jgi:hypothetical protein
MEIWDVELHGAMKNEGCKRVMNLVIIGFKNSRG